MRLWGLPRSEEQGLPAVPLALTCQQQLFLPQSLPHFQLYSLGT